MAVLRFCPRCGTRMGIQKTGRKSLFTCSKCGYSEPAKEVKIPVIKNKAKPAVKIVTAKDDELRPLPITDTKCPSCGNDKAFWWMLQTRGADESPTQFFRCTKCGHTWREYT